MYGEVRSAAEFKLFTENLNENTTFRAKADCRAGVQKAQDKPIALLYGVSK